MTAHDGFDRTVAAWLRDDAVPTFPDQLDALLVRTSTTPQRRWWSSPERWLPMDTTLRPRLFDTPRAGQVLLVAALIVALVGAALLYEGTHQTHLPPPFGPARNGIILSSGNTDIVVVDPATGSRTILVRNGFGPDTSRDGTKFLFLRPAPAGCGKPDCGLFLMSADIDGSNVRQVTPTAVSSLDWADWSPDGSKIAFLEADRVDGFGRVLATVNADGTGLWVDPAHRHVYPAGWLPPNGDEIVVRQEHLVPKDPAPAIWAMHPDGTGRRLLTTRAATDDSDFFEVAVSPDGQSLAYTAPNPSLSPPWQVHILSLQTGSDLVLPQPTGSAQFRATFSPDGKQVAYLRSVAGDRFQLVVAPIDGSSMGALIGTPAGVGSDGPSINNYSWSADGTAILANYEIERVARLIPVDGSATIDLDHGDVALPNMQRLAP